METVGTVSLGIRRKDRRQSGAKIQRPAAELPDLLPAFYKNYLGKSSEKYEISILKETGKTEKIEIFKEKSINTSSYPCAVLRM